MSAMIKVVSRPLPLSVLLPLCLCWLCASVCACAHSALRLPRIDQVLSRCDTQYMRNSSAAFEFLFQLQHPPDGQACLKPVEYSSLHFYKSGFGAWLGNVARGWRSHLVPYIPKGEFLYSTRKRKRKRKRKGKRGSNRALSPYFEPFTTHRRCDEEANGIGTASAGPAAASAGSELVHSLSEMELIGLVARYMLRLTPRTLAAIQKTMVASLRAGAGAGAGDGVSVYDEFDPRLAISMPVRSTDKCFNKVTERVVDAATSAADLARLHVNNRKIRGGRAPTSLCPSVDEYVDIAFWLREKADRDIRFLVVNSEDARVVAAIKKHPRIVADGRWTIITNVAEQRAKHGGHLTGKEQTYRPRHKVRMFHALLSSLLMNSLCCKYTLAWRPSHWHELIAALSKMYPLSFDEHIEKHVLLIASYARIMSSDAYLSIHPDTKYIKFDDALKERLQSQSHIGDEQHEKFGHVLSVDQQLRL